MLKQKFITQFILEKTPYSIRCPLSEMEKLLRRRNYKEFVARFCGIFYSMREQNLFLFLKDDQEYFTKLFELWFKLLANPAFKIVRGDEMLYYLNASVTNILAVTPHKNGDDCLLKIAQADGDLNKILLLYTPRSRLQLPISELFTADANTASLWYSNLWNWNDTYAHPVVYNNMRYFMENFDNRFEPFDSNLICAYFRCTYVDSENDVAFKAKLNNSIRSYCHNINIYNKPRKNSLAIVSAYWDGSHAVYRAFAPYVSELAKSYDLTLVNLALKGRKIDSSLFKRVFEVSASSEKVNLENIINNDFQLAYYPDIGMSQASMYLSNIRLAPIQLVSTGHPVSTANSEIDYFISGNDEELPIGAENNYGERLVLLPSISANPVKPQYTPQYLTPPTNQDSFLINCPWMHMKINYPVLVSLKKMIKKSAKKLVFQFFPGNGAAKNNAFMATIQDLVAVLGCEHTIVHEDLPYNNYMHIQEKGLLTLHSYPFGGGTTAVDALIIRKPLIIWEGTKEYNRYSAVLLRRLGFEELVAKNEDEFIEKTVRLANDDKYYQYIIDKLKEADLDEKIFKIDSAVDLKKAVDFLIANHTDLQNSKDRTPIRIT